MKIKLNLIITVLLISVLGSLNVFSASYSWYFKPESNGKQPELIPEVDGFIDNYNTITIGADDEKKIYLTFDAGYENGNVEKILDILKEKNVNAAFFVLPLLSEKNSDLLMRMKKEGHLICNHTETHRDMSKITDKNLFFNELKNAELILKEHTGLDMDKFYRPPEGRFSEDNLKWADSLGYTTVFWSLAYADWDNNKQMSHQKALELITSRTHNGCVLLLHPTSDTNAAILGDYIERMRTEGYEFGSLYEFVKNGDSNEKNN